MRKMPNLQTDDLLRQALNDRDFLRLLLERPVVGMIDRQSLLAAMRLQRTRFSKITGGLLQAGLLSQDGYEEWHAEADAHLANLTP